MTTNIQTNETSSPNAARHSRWKDLQGTGNSTGGAESAFAKAFKKQIEIHETDAQVAVLPEKTKADAQEAAAGLVTNALILPILKQVRRSTFGENSVFSGGNGEKTFGPQFDMSLAEHMANSPRMTATTVLKERILKKAAITAHAAKPLLKGLDVNG